MKVKVIKASLDTYWYADRIGDVFEVSPAKFLNWSDGAEIYAYTVVCGLGDFIEWADCVPLVEENKTYIVTYLPVKSKFGSYEAAYNRAKNILEADSWRKVIISEVVSEVTAEQELKFTVKKV